MNKTVVLGLLSVAGLAASANAQTTPALIEVRVIIDGQAGAPTGTGIVAFLPGPGATRVGLTLQARLLTYGAPATFGTNSFGPQHNYGIGYQLASDPNGFSRISHNDVLSNGYTGALRRGNVTASRRGLFSPFQYWSGTVPATINGETGNPVGASLESPGVLTTNGFISQDANNRTQIQGFFPSRNLNDNFAAVPAGVLPVPDPNDPDFEVDPNWTPAPHPALLNAFPDYGVGTNANPAASPWQNLYRVYFDPVPNVGHPNREVTVTFSNLRLAGLLVLNLSTSVAGPWGQGTYGFIQTTLGAGDFSTTATFMVPVPGALALLGLGGLVAGRRRRA